MSSEQPPNPIVDTFNPEYWRISADDGITTQFLDANYVKFPLSQNAQETFVAIPNISATMPPSNDSSTKIPTTAWVQSAIPSVAGFATLAGTNAFTGSNSFSLLSTCSATMPLSSDDSSVIPSTAWVQDAIDAKIPAVDNLTAVLTAGNDGGGLSMTNLNDVGLTTINGAVYPPVIPTPTDINITDDNTSATFYPVFVSGTGTQTLKADTTTTQFSLNPNTSDFNVGSTLKLTQTQVAVGKTSGTSQGTNSIAIGAGAGTTQTTNCVAVGGLAGQSQTNAGVAVGYRAGQTSQGLYAVAVGLTAGNDTQSQDGIAIGRQAGQTTQGANCVAVGLNAGNNTQSAGSVAIGSSAGQTTQSTNAVAVGLNAGTTSQGGSSVAIGINAGNASQGASAVAVGNQSGQTTQGDNAVAIGLNAGASSQSADCVAIGVQTAQFTQGSFGIAIGTQAGRNTQGTNSVAIGRSAGLTSQGGDSIAIGRQSATLNQGANAVAIGLNAGNNGQGTGSVAVGISAGITTQGQLSVAVGQSSAETSQGNNAVAVGYLSGRTTQGAGAVAIGNNAGTTNQGGNAVAIGSLAGNSGQTAGSIALNASGVALNPAVAGFFVNPIRADATEHLPLQYNTTTNEVSNFSWTDLLTPISFNPVLQSSDGSNLNSGNYDVRNGYYIQLGKIVWYEVRIQISGKGGLGTAGNDIRITLPITASSITDLTQSLNIGNITGMNTSIVSAFCNIPSGGQDFVVFPLKETAGTGTANMEVGDIGSAFQIRFGGFYFTD